MKLINLVCSNCGAEMKVNQDLKQCSCNYCGKVMIVEEEVQKHEFVNGYAYGYDLERGRLKAQEDFKLEQERRELERKEQERLEEERRRAEEVRQIKEERKNRLIKWLKISGVILIIGLLLCFSSRTVSYGYLLIITSIGLLGYKAYKIFLSDEKGNFGDGREIIQIQCARCGGKKCSVISETTTTGKDFSASKGCLGALLFGPLGILCGSCGEGKTTISTNFWVCNNCGYKWKM